jgi:hypothetical protein
MSTSSGWGAGVRREGGTSSDTTSQNTDELGTAWALLIHV